MKKSVVSTVECPRCGAYANEEYWYYTKERQIDCPECGYTYSKVQDYDFYSNHPEVLDGMADLDMLEYENGELITKKSLYKDNAGQYNNSKTRKDGYLFKIIKSMEDFISEQIDVFLQYTKYAELLLKNIDAYMSIPYEFLVFGHIENFSNQQLDVICNEIIEYEMESFVDKKPLMEKFYDNINRRVNLDNYNLDKMKHDWVNMLVLISCSENIDDYIIRRFIKFAMWTADKRRTSGTISLAARYATESLNMYMETSMHNQGWFYSDKIKARSLRVMLEAAKSCMDYAAGKNDSYDDIGFIIYDLNNV